MKDIWIDLTDIEQWSGHHGGTQRVVYGISKNFYLNQENVHYFTYSPADNEFYEADFKPIYDRVESLKSAANHTINNTGSTRTLKHRIKDKVLPYIPNRIMANEVLKGRIKKTARYAIISASRARSVAGRPLRHLSTKGGRIERRNPINLKKDDVVLILGKPWDEPGLQTLLDKKKYEIGFKVVQVVYDLIISLRPHLHHPSLFHRYTQQMFKAAQGSDLLLSISESSKQDMFELCDRLSISRPKIEVIRLGDEVEGGSNEDVLRQLNINDEFMLCVGTIENRKNHTLLYYVYKLAIERGVKLPQLVIVGGDGWLSGDIRYLISNDPEVKEYIRVLNNVNDASLLALYKKALFTVYPSFYEGWGLPVAESLAHGTPVAASKTSSIPEVGGDLVDYFSPYSVEECLTVMSKLTDPEVRGARRARIASAYKITSWNDTYTQVLSLIKTL